MLRYFIAAFLLLIAIAVSCEPCFAQRGRIDSASAQILEQQVLDTAAAGDFNAAVAIGKRLIDGGQTDSAVYYITAISLGLAGKKEEGRRYFDTAVAKGYDRNDPSSKALLGLFKVHSKAEIDSAFDALHRDADKAAEVMPTIFTNRQLYRLYAEVVNEKMFLMQEWVKLDTGFYNAIEAKCAENARRRVPTVVAMIPALMKTGSPADLQGAAVTLIDLPDTTDFRLAYQLGMRALELGDSTARRIVAATLDRYLVLQRKPQRYGTQMFLNDSTGKYQLYPIDPTVTDAERAKWEVPSLKEEEERVVRMNEILSSTKAKAGAAPGRDVH